MISSTGIMIYLLPEVLSAYALGQDFEHLTLCSKCSNYSVRRPGTKPRKRLPPNNPLSLDLPRLKKADGRKAISLVLG